MCKNTCFICSFICIKLTWTQESGEKYAQIKHGLQAKTKFQNNSKQKQTKNTGSVIMGYFGQNWQFKVKMMWSIWFLQTWRFLFYLTRH